MKKSAKKVLEDNGYTFLREVTNMLGEIEELWENGDEWILVDQDGIVTWQDSNERYQEEYK